MKTIALFGGSFDPPHIGHEAVVKALIKLEYLDKIIIMPTFLSPFKSNFFAPSELRLKWLKTIFSKNKKIIIDNYEVNLMQQIPTIQTVNYLLKSYEKIFVVIGADNLQTLKNWQQFNELKKKVQFIVASRDQITIPKNFIKLHVDEKVSSSDLRKVTDKTKFTTICADEIAQYYYKHKEPNEQ